MSDELQEIVRAVKAYIELEKESGVEEFFSAEPTVAAGRKPAQDLESLKKEVVQCRSCGLAKTRLNVVFGSGNPKAELLFVGEAPGSEEDIQGLPFVGRAGQLLTKIIEAMDLKREMQAAQ